MPVYQITAPNGRTYRISGPAGASQQDVVNAVLAQHPDAAQPAEEENLLEQVPVVGGLLAGAADIPLSAVEGLAGSLRTFSDVFGANNAASQFFGDVAEGAGEMRSSGSREDAAAGARIMQEAEGKGVWEETKAALQAFALSPLETTASVAGSALPYAAAGLAAAAAAPETGGASLAALYGLLGSGAAGGVSGVGMIKGDIYDAMYQSALEHNVSEGEARAIAERAQEYGGPNTDMQALGGLLGAAAGATGLSRSIVGSVVRRAESEIVRRATENVARRSLVRGALTGAVEEAVPEAIQAGQERFAQNLAERRGGYDQDLWSGVAGQAAFEGIASLLPGAYGGRSEAKSANLHLDREFINQEFEALPERPTAEDMDAAVQRFVDRGFSEEVATRVVSRLNAEKQALAERAANAERLRRAALGDEEVAADEDVIYGQPPAMDEAEAAAMQRFYEEEALGRAPDTGGFEPSVSGFDEADIAGRGPAPTAGPEAGGLGRAGATATGVAGAQGAGESALGSPGIKAKPARFYNAEQATAMLDDADAVDRFAYEQGLDYSEAVEILQEIAQGRGPSIRYSRRGPRGKDTQTPNLFDLQTQQAPGEELKRQEYNEQRFASDEEKLARQEQAAQEREVGLERAAKLQERTAEQREEVRGDIEYALRAQAPENAVYRVLYEPEDTNAPYKLVAETNLGKKPELVLKAKTLQELSDKVYGQMEELTPYTPETPTAMEELEQRAPQEQEAPTVATRMVQEFVREVDAARDAGQIDNNQRAQLLGRLQRPNAYRTLPNGRTVANDAIAKLEEAALEAASVERNALAEDKEAASAARSEANKRLSNAVKNSLLNPARATLKSMIETRQDEKLGAKVRVKEAQQAATEAETVSEFREAKKEEREAKIDTKELKVQKYRRSTESQAAAKPVSVKDVLALVNKIVSQWESAVPVKVVQSVAEITDSDLRAAITADGAFNAEGLVAPDGTIYLIADNLTSAEDVKAVLFHEALGHVGLTQLFRSELDNVLTAMYEGNAQLKADTDKWMQDNPDAYTRDVNPLARAVEEVLAERSESGPLQRSLLQKIAAVVRGFARRLGIGLKLSDNDITTILSMAHDKIVRGDTESVTLGGLRYIKEDRIRVPAEAAKTFLKELGLFNNRELFDMPGEEASMRAARVGIDQEWMDYFMSHKLAAWAPAGSEPVKLPQPDMSKYMPKYSRPKTKPKTKPKTAEELQDSQADMSAGLRRTQKSSNTNGIADGLEETIKGRNYNAFVDGLKENYDDISSPALEKVLKTLPTSGIIGWFGKDIRQLKDIDRLVNEMVNMKTNILKAADPIAKVLDEFLVTDKNQTLANAMSIFRINELSPEDLQNNKVLKEVESRILANANNKQAAQQLIADIKTLVEQKKSAVQVEGDKTKLSPAVRAKLGQLTKDAVDGTKTGEHVDQLVEISRRLRDAREAWDKLGELKNGHKLYKAIRDFYKDMFEAELALLDSRIDNLMDEREAKRLKDLRAEMMREALDPEEAKKHGGVLWNIDSSLFSKDYFPFMRTGKYWLRVKEGKNGTREREFYTFESARERNKAKRAVARRLGVNPEDANVLTIGDNVEELQNDLRTEDAMMQKVFDLVGGVKEKMEKSGVISKMDVKDLTDSIYQTWLLSTPERSVRRRFMHAEEVVGFQQDVLRQFSSQVTTYANQLSKMAYAGDIRTKISEARDTIGDSERPNSQQAKLNTVVSEFETRAEQELNPDPQNAAINLLNRASYFYYLTSARTALINLTSIPVRVLPRLWRDYGFAKGNAMYLQYMNLYKTLGNTRVETVKTGLGDQLHAIMPSITGSKRINAKTARGELLRRAMKAGEQRNALETSLNTMVQNERETARRQRTGAARTGVQIAEGAASAMSVMFQGMENISRQAAYFMTFELAYDDYLAKNPGKADEAFEHAVEQAINTTRDTLGDYTNWERPSLLKNNLTRAAFLFKMYPIVQTRFFVGAFRDIIKGTMPGATAEAKAERAGAMKELAGVTMMAGVFGGIMAMPLYSVLAWALAQSFDEEDDDDVRALMGMDPRTAYDSDLMFRTWMADTFGTPEVGDVDLADILTYGPISALTNTDIGGSTSMDLKNMWFREAVADDSTFQSVLKAALTNVAGLNMLQSFASGLDEMAEGNFYEGLRKGLPAFFRTWVAAAQGEAEGIRTSNGDVIIAPEDITAFDTMRTITGFRPLKLTHLQNYSIKRAGNERRINSERRALLDRLDQMRMDGEISSMDDLRKYWQEEIVPFNRTYPDPMFIITPETIENSLKRREERRERTVQGMVLDSDLEQARKDYEAARAFRLR